MAKKMKYEFSECVRKMPPLMHNTESGEFDICKSEVAAWIVKQPKVLQKIFDTARYHGVIQYDRSTGTWQGVDYDDGD